MVYFPFYELIIIIKYVLYLNSGDGFCLYIMSNDFSVFYLMKIRFILHQLLHFNNFFGIFFILWIDYHYQICIAKASTVHSVQSQCVHTSNHLEFTSLIEFKFDLMIMLNHSGPILLMMDEEMMLLCWIFITELLYTGKYHIATKTRAVVRQVESGAMNKRKVSGKYCRKYWNFLDLIMIFCK